MDQEFPTLTSGMKVGRLAERIARHDPTLARHEALLILSDTGKLPGIITRGDLLRALDRDPPGAMDCSGRGHVPTDRGSSRRACLRSGLNAAR